jgi:quercetin dioxygenase-like cupin family protein
MKSFAILRKVVLPAVLAICLGAPRAIAQDMDKVAPATVKVVLDNDKVKVFDVKVKAGDKHPMHSHPSNLVIAMNSGKVRTTMADGKATGIDFMAGDVRWSDAVKHANEAITEMHVVLVELKDHNMKKK